MSARFYRISYAGFSVGSATDDAYLQAPFEYVETSRKIDISFVAVVHGQNQADLRSKQESLEAAFSTRFSRLVIERFGTIQTYDQANNTGYNMFAQCKELDDPDFTGLLRAYECSVAVSLPINDSSEPGQEGLIDLSFAVTENESEARIINVSGSYNALPGDVGARERFNDNLSLLLDDLESDLDPDAVWERTQLTYQPERFNKFIEFSINSRELIDRQSIALKDDPDIKTHSLQVKTVFANNGFSYVQTSPLQEAVASFSCFINKNRTTDLQRIWREKIYQLMLQEIRNNIGASKLVAVGRQEPQFSFSDNSITVTILVVFRQSSSIVESFESYSIQETIGAKLEPIADRSSNFAADILPATPSAQRQVVRSLVVNGDEAEARRRMKEFKAASSIVPAGKKTDLKTGSGTGRHPGRGRPLKPSEVPNFGAKNGYWFDVVFQEPQVSQVTIGTAITSTLTQITQVITSVFYVPAKMRVAGPPKGSNDGIFSIADDL